MSRLIDADDLKTAFPCGEYVRTESVRATIDNMPTITPERKTGKWLKVGGYVTPGGDPVWCCSECGKGVHVYGIEHGTYGSNISDGQWVACPNCDAKMEDTE